MEGFLVCLIVLSYVTGGSLTKEANPCQTDDIPCDDGSCTEKWNWCDRFADCTDKSDEKYCGPDVFSDDGYIAYECNESLHFECANKKCVPKVSVCDEFDNCGDKSDEQNCTKPEERETEIEEPLSTSVVYPISPGVSRTTPAPFSPREAEPFPDPSATQAPFNPRDVRRREYVPYSYPTHRPTPVSPREAVTSYPDPRATPAPFNPREVQVRGGVPSYPDPRRTSARYPHPAVGKPKPVRHWPLPAFRFVEDRATSFGRRYDGELIGAERWLMGREVTPRALVALSLAQNSFRPNTTNYEVMRRRLKLDLGAKLFRNKENNLDSHELAMYIDALMATCQDPRQIYGQDLVSLLYNRTHDPRRRTEHSPFVLLTLCLANSSVTNDDFGFLQYMVDSANIGEVSKDRFILSTSALACIHKRGLYANELRRLLGTASRKLLEQQYDDGSFGSIYSTALAAQAFFALDSNSWNPDRTLDFLLRHQSHDGSFGDLLATSYILPVLSGRSLIHLRNTECETPKDETSSEDSGWEIRTGPTKTIWYSLAIGPEQRNRITWQITVPLEANFFEIMQEAQKLHPRFRFLYTESFGKIDVYTISDVPNDPERGTYWQLYVLDRREQQIVYANQIFSGDVRNLTPGDNQELLYWYLPYRGSLEDTGRQNWL